MEWVEGTELARGATAVVTRGTVGIVIKTLDPALPPVVARVEAAATKAAHDAGLPTAALLGFDEGPPPRLTLEFVEGVPLASLIAGPGPTFVGEHLARCQHLIRLAALPADAAVPPVATLLGFQIEAGPLSEDVKATLLDELDELPVGGALCHLDLHPLNVLWHSNTATIIDWTNARTGPPAVDIARTRVMLEALPHYSGGSPTELADCADVLRAYLAETERLAPAALRDSDQWMRVVSAARLDEHPPEAERLALLTGLGAVAPRRP